MATKNKITLVVMAAGMGSRFGGLKQAEPITPKGSAILDFSIYDAIEAGFDDVVLIIREDIKKDFIELVGNRISSKITTHYVMQDMTLLPEGRTKPFGTAHAIYCCKDLIKNPFAVINADDYYGKSAFIKMANHLRNASENQTWAMVAYELDKTLSDFGTVSRGVSKVEKNHLKEITEITKISPEGTYEKDGKTIKLDKKTPVSMNFWGFQPDFFPFLVKEFENFRKNADLLKDEFLLPNVVKTAIKNKINEVTVLKSDSTWFGITYKEDLPHVKEKLNELISKKEYVGL